MLSEIFYWLLNMSIIGTIVGFIILILRKIKGFPPFVSYVLWIIPLIRLWIPFGIGNKYSLMNWISRFTTKTVVAFGGFENLPQFTQTNFIMAANNYSPIVYKTKLLKNVFSTASVIWIIIALASLIASFLMYYFTKVEMKSAVHYKDNIYLSDKILSPFVYGVLKSKIFLPYNITEAYMPYIILHEEVHIKRKDNLYRVIAVATACLHWFNPFVWIFLKHFFSDMELSCDEKVLKLCGAENKGEYAKALINFEESKAIFASAFGGAKIRVRIESILSYKKLTVISSLCFTVLIFVISIILLTNPVK